MSGWRHPCVYTTKVLEETLVYLSDAPRELEGPHGKGPTYQRVKRWCEKGVNVRRSRPQRRATLEWCYIGSLPVTSKEAFRRFSAAIKPEGER